MVVDLIKQDIDARFMELGDSMIEASDGRRRGVAIGVLIDRLKDVAIEALKDLSLVGLDDETKQKIVAAWVTAYNELIKPLDLPYVPNGMIEDAVDKMILEVSVFFLKQLLRVE